MVPQLIAAPTQLASLSTETLNDIVNMLDELSLSLPRFRSYEENLPMDDALESALIEVYTEMTCFCARTINFFRSNPHRKFPELTTSTIFFLAQSELILHRPTDKIELAKVSE